MTDVADVSDLIDFLDSSPSPWHAAANAATRLVSAGFEPLDRAASWDGLPAAGFVHHGASLVAWRAGSSATAASALRVIGAHTDSPGLRIKPRPDCGGVGWRQLGVEVYGSALLNSWLDRDLGIAGRVVLADGSQADVAAYDALCRVPQLAIHLDRDVNERGLVLDKQANLTPVWGTGVATSGDFARWLGVQLGVESTAVGAWDLCLFDRTPAALLGSDQSLLASGRLDNQLSCWAAIDALCSTTAQPDTVSMVALFDHEEVGSESTTGAAGPLLEHVIERLTIAAGGARQQLLERLARSTCVSADNAHAVHPNYRDRHEPEHMPIVTKGPAIKINSNQRYATSASTAAMLQRCFVAADVPHQLFVSRNNMPCGSTIGPITATRLGIDTVDVGVPQLSMHSARELCAASDALHLAAGLRSYLTFG